VAVATGGTSLAGTGNKYYQESSWRTLISGMIGIDSIAEDLYAFAVKEELERQVECKLRGVGDGSLGSNLENMLFFDCGGQGSLHWSSVNAGVSVHLMHEQRYARTPTHDKPTLPPQPSPTLRHHIRHPYHAIRSMATQLSDRNGTGREAGLRDRDVHVDAGLVP
jgi:hypothetical protein